MRPTTPAYSDGPRGVGIAVIVAALCAAGCDSIGFNDVPKSAQPSGFQPRAVRSLINEPGLQAMYRVDHPQGARLAYDRRQSTAGGLELTIGPISRQVAVESWQVTARRGQIEVSFETTATSVTLPLRVTDRRGTRICRYSVDVDRAFIEASAEVDNFGAVPTLVVDDPPDVVLSGATISAVDACPPVTADDGLDTATLDGLLADYLTDAWRASGRDAIEISPLDTLGLVYSPVELQRISHFQNRRGRLEIAGRVTDPAGAKLSADGLAVDLDMAISSRRAGCAPPLNADSPTAMPASVVPTGALGQADADVGMAVAATVLQRLAQAATRSGFVCRGLEHISLDGESSNLAADDLRFQDVGLGALPVGAWVEPVVSPAGLPSIEMNPSNGTIDLTWKDLSVDLYARVNGLPVRILRLTTSLDMSARPIVAANSVDLAIESVSVAHSTVQSRWAATGALAPDLDGWTRRTMLLVLRDTFSLPLPVEPGASLELTAGQVRQNDLLLLFEFDRHF